MEIWPEGFTMGRSMLLQHAGVVCVALALTVLWMRHYPPRPKLAVVDIALLVKEREEQISKQVLRPGVTDDDRKQAYDRIAAFGRDLDAVLSALPAHCRCVVLNKAAVIGDAEDLTAFVRGQVQ